MMYVYGSMRVGGIGKHDKTIKTGPGFCVGVVFSLFTFKGFEQNIKC